MSDGQLAQTHEEWVKTHDELAQLRDKLAEIRKRGGWMEGVPEEDGYYWCDLGWSKPPTLVFITTDQDQYRGVVTYYGEENCTEVEPIRKYQGCKFARVLTPEDLE